MRRIWSYEDCVERLSHTNSPVHTGISSCTFPVGKKNLPTLRNRERCSAVGWAQLHRAHRNWLPISAQVYSFERGLSGYGSARKC